MRSSFTHNLDRYSTGMDSEEQSPRSIAKIERIGSTISILSHTAVNEEMYISGVKCVCVCVGGAYVACVYVSLFLCVHTEAITTALSTARYVSAAASVVTATSSRSPEQ
jgi:hypothetical protein